LRIAEHIEWPVARWALKLFDAQIKSVSIGRLRVANRHLRRSFGDDAFRAQAF